METAVSFRRAPPPPPPHTPPSLHTVVAPPPPQPPRSPTQDLVPWDRPTPRGIISISDFRRPHAAKNNYVDSPVASTPATATVHTRTGIIYNGCSGQGTNGTDSVLEVPPRLPITQQPQSQKNKSLVIHQQPKKPASPSGAPGSLSVDDTASGGNMSGHNGSAECKASIYCPHCQKCRCGQCTEQKELPKTWLCGNKFECSCQKCVDYTSCLCLVRGVFYHTCANADGDTSVSPSDEPCACCEQPHCCKRWSCMAAMAMALPCLCLYWPLQCCQHMITWGYNRCCRRNGCRCHRGRDRTKGLLLDSESSSA